MNLVFLHGPPASGKFTIATEVANRISCGVFHNHLTIDLARPFFEFGSKEFWSFVQNLRLACFREAAACSSQTVIYTSCYDHPADLEFFEKIESIVESAGGKVLPIYLKADTPELEARVVSQSRAEMGKIRSVEGLHRQLGRWNCIPVPRESCCIIVTDGETPQECAGEVLAAISSRLCA